MLTAASSPETFAVDIALGGTNPVEWPVGYSLYARGSLNATVQLVSIGVRFLTTGMSNIKPKVYTDSAALVAAGPAISLNVTDTTKYYEVPFTAPVYLMAGTQYYLGTYVSSGPGQTTVVDGLRIVQSVPPGYTWTAVGEDSYYAVGDVAAMGPSSGTEACYRLNFKP